VVPIIWCFESGGSADWAFAYLNELWSTIRFNLVNLRTRSFSRPLERLKHTRKVVEVVVEVLVIVDTSSVLARIRCSHSSADVTRCAP
jgi:hypothetical protein